MRSSLYYFTRYNNAPVDSDAIAAKLDVAPQVAEGKLEKLYQADLAPC